MSDPIKIMFAAALKQFGAGLAIAAVFAYAIARMYEDAERRNDTIISLVRQQSEASFTLAAALDNLTEELKTK